MSVLQSKMQANTKNCDRYVGAGVTIEGSLLPFVFDSDRWGPKMLRVSSNVAYSFRLEERSKELFAEITGRTDKGRE